MAGDNEGWADEDVAERVLESDPGGNGPAGLAGEMGLSSERRGEDVGSPVPGTHGAKPVQSPPVEDPPPEQSPDVARGGPETPTPEDTDDYRAHEHDPGSTQPHSHG